VNNLDLELNQKSIQIFAKL